MYLAEVKTPQGDSNKMGIVLPLVGLAGLGIAGYFIYKAWDKKREEGAIKNANKETLSHTLNIQKTKEKLQKVEAGAYLKGVTANSPKKEQSVNIITQVKSLINQFFIKRTDKYGKDTYTPRGKDDINETIVHNIFFNTPFKFLPLLSKTYTIYTASNLNEDINKLSPKLRESIKSLYDLSYKKFPAYNK
jgi:hypothetical protein